MNEDYDLIAPFYDIEHAHFDEDIDLYMNFAELRGGPLLELVCGSGRLLLPLAHAGYEVTGVDTSAAMLDLVRLALETAGVAAHLCSKICARCSLIRSTIWRLPVSSRPGNMLCV